jgi:D-glycero-alpha-D-manno-heptose-7-phosphate kinase
MIISKTPYRISFFGGGSDYPEWYNEFGGAVLSTTINKYLYITCRELPGFFDHKYRIVWRKIERVKNIEEIKHQAIKGILKHYKYNKGLEIHYDGDLPARSGMGSSSSFVVGLINALFAMDKKNLSKKDLAKRSLFIEQKILNEIVGSQDQIAATYGGFNKISFQKNSSFKIKKIKTNKNLKLLEDNLILIYTSINRTAHHIASSYVKNLTSTKKNYIKEIINHVEEGEKIIKHGNMDDFGKLLNSAWYMKKKLGKSITNNKIDDLYEYALKNGALGGKILGAGGGGFLLLYMKQKDRIKFINKKNKIINIPFKFSDTGSEIIFKEE